MMASCLNSGKICINEWRRFLLVAFLCGMTWVLPPVNTPSVNAQEPWLRSGVLFERNAPLLRFQGPDGPFQNGPESIDAETAGGEPARESERSENPFEDHIETDRDSYTPATTTVAARRWIVESAYSFIDNRHSVDTHSLPETVLRYGLTRRIELRLGFNFEVGGGGNVVSSSEGEEGLEGNSISRESRLFYGLKLRTTDQNGWIPESSLILQGFSPTSGSATKTEVGATYVFGWELPGRWKLDSAIHYETDSEGNNDWANWNPSVVMRAPIGERLALHAEYFGIFPHGQPDGSPQHYFSPGVHVLVTPDLELGVRLGWGLNDASARFFSNVGFGVRF